MWQMAATTGLILFLHSLAAPLPQFRRDDATR